MCIFLWYYYFYYKWARVLYIFGLKEQEVLSSLISNKMGPIENTTVAPTLQQFIRGCTFDAEQSINATHHNFVCDKDYAKIEELTIDMSDKNS